MPKLTMEFKMELKYNDKAEELVKLLSRLVPDEGVRVDVIKNVHLFRITSFSKRNPQTYDPGIIILAQGSKRIFIGDEILTYDPLNYLVLSVPLPLECETTASPKKPLLGLKIQVDAAAVGEILLATNDAGKRVTSFPRGYILLLWMIILWMHQSGLPRRLCQERTEIFRSHDCQGNNLQSFVR